MPPERFLHSTWHLLLGMALVVLVARRQHGHSRQGRSRRCPLIGFVNGASGDASAGNVAAFQKRLGESGYVEGQNVTVEYHWLNGD